MLKRSALYLFLLLMCCSFISRAQPIKIDQLQITPKGNPSSINRPTWWFLDTLIQANQSLYVKLVEGKTSNTDAFIEINGKKLNIGKSINVPNNPKAVLFTFRNFLAYQRVDETYTMPDNSEIHETTSPAKGKYYYQVITKSKYLDYLNKEHGWYQNDNPLKLYRICTLDDIIEVASFEPPVFEELEIIAK